MPVLLDNPKYSLCEACGGTGLALTCKLGEDGRPTVQWVSSTMGRYYWYAPCFCQYGQEYKRLNPEKANRNKRNVV